MTITPINGGVKSIQLPQQVVPELQRMSDTLRRLFGLEPRPTVWEIEGGRPIYDRLPSVSEAYKIHPEDSTAGKVYLSPNGQKGSGAGSLQSLLLEENRIGINSGTISWPEGTTTHDFTVIDINSLDFPSGRWFLTYELLTNSEPQSFIYSIENQLLEEVDGWTATSPSEVCGSEAIYALYDSRERFFEPTGSLTINFSVFANFTKIEVPILLTPLGETEITRNLPTLISNLNPTSPYFGQYNNETQSITFDSLSYSSNLEWITISYPLSPAFAQQIKNIRFSGQYEIVSAPENSIQTASLAIYNLSDEEVRTSVLCLLAYFETDATGTIKAFKDIRKITSVKNEPVAAWLTEAIDTDLKYYYNEYKNYVNKWMDPRTLGFGVYEREINERILSN